MERIHCTARRGHGALILVVLIAMAIVLYLMFGTGGGGGSSYTKAVATSRQSAKATVQDVNTQQLTILIAQYRQENGKLPTRAEDLENDRAFRDPWNNLLTFTFSDVRGTTKVTYRSNGPDGEANTEDDVVKNDVLPY